MSISGLDVEALRRLLLELARERSLARVLERITATLAEQQAVALARIWLVRPGDICAICPRREECSGHVPCLHLVASAGRPFEAGADWTRVNGEFRRFPIGRRKVGRVGASGEPLLVNGLSSDSSFAVHQEWIKDEKIEAFAGQPLVYHDEILGVLGVFSRRSVEAESLRALRLLADHAAAAIANARAFEEIERLRSKLELENEYLKEEVGERHFGDIVAVSRSLRRTLEQVEMVAPTNATVLILGESGTGKELIAREVHERSRRRTRPLIRVNCASVPRELFESEFFGHVRGAFTGAQRDRQGRFAAASSGTLFLDEVGEIPQELQGKLLRVLQEGQYERVGEERTRSVDVRLIAATNRDLDRQVTSGEFREDLYYRLNVFPVSVEPLRKRREDIGPLATHFLGICARTLGTQTPVLSQAHLQELESYDWPGNVRELKNVIHRAMITSKGGRLTFELPSRRSPDSELPPLRGRERAAPYRTEKEMRELERENLIAVLAASRWKIYGEDGAAARLGIKPTTLAARVRKFGICKPV